MIARLPRATLAATQGPPALALGRPATAGAGRTDTLYIYIYIRERSDNTDLLPTYDFDF